MKNKDDEGSIRLVLTALIIVAITIAVFLIPAPPAEAPSIELIELPARVEAAEISEYKEVAKPVLRAELLPICGCESAGDPNKEPVHYESDGVTLLVGKINPRDRGMCQINLDAHLETSIKKGYDILHNKADYINYSNELYAKQGDNPWRYSKSCWKK